MRITAGSLIFTSFSLLQLGCGDNGGDMTAGPTTNTPTTITNTTDPGTDPGTESVGTGTDTDEPTIGGNSATESATDTEGPTTTDTTSALTDTTDPTTEDPTTETSTTDPGTNSNSNSNTDPETESNSDPSGTPCEEIKATLNPLVPNIMLVLDKSGSMVSMPNGFWDHDADPGTAKISRWNSLYSVVQTVVTGFDDKLAFGANLFPKVGATEDYNAMACQVNMDVEIPVALNNGGNILGNIPQPMDVSLRGGTPAAAGVSAALAHLKTLDPVNPRAIMLITDGAANCSSDANNVPMQLFEVYDDNLHEIVDAALMTDGIPTYVVGIDIKNMVTGVVQDGNPNGINPFEKLNDLATKGGKPKNDPNEKFYNAVNQIELQAAMDEIVADALSCIIPLASEPVFPDKTEVVVGGVKLPNVTDCTTENGWVYVNPMGPYNAVELCGTACDSLKMLGEADVNFFCDAG